METHSAEYHREWYRKQSSEKKQKIFAVRDKRRKEILAWLRVYKSKRGCARCPETDWRCLDFHHLSGKEFNLGECTHLGWSKERLLKEIAKCIILCANCHRKETFLEIAG